MVYYCIVKNNSHADKIINTLIHDKIEKNVKFYKNYLDFKGKLPTIVCLQKGSLPLLNTLLDLRIPMPVAHVASVLFTIFELKNAYDIVMFLMAREIVHLEFIVEDKKHNTKKKLLHHILEDASIDSKNRFRLVEALRGNLEDAHATSIVERHI